MEIEVNNEVMSIPRDFTVGMLLKYISYTHSVAVFVNGKQLLMGEYNIYKLKENDRVRVIKPLGGG